MRPPKMRKTFPSTKATDRDMKNQTNLARIAGSTLVVALLCGFGALACKRPPPAPPPQPATFGPEERILTVGKAWREMTQSEGFVNQADVAFMRVTDQFTLHLESGSLTGLVDIERKELLRSPDGREFHCTVSGAVKVSVKYDTLLDEARVSMHMPESTLPRKCREKGFAKHFKEFPGLSATYALRGDQLIAVEPVTLRSSLIPVD